MNKCDSQGQQCCTEIDKTISNKQRLSSFALMIDILNVTCAINKL